MAPSMTSQSSDSFAFADSTVDHSVTLRDQLQAARQGHLWDHLQRLPSAQARQLAEQLASLDWPLLVDLQTQLDARSLQPALPLDSDAITPPTPLVRCPAHPTPAERDRQQAARALGEEALRAGRVAALLVAGGQGTRLGFAHPKGMFPCGPLSKKSLFQWFAEQLTARGRKVGHEIPYLIMTSPATHAETVAFWTEHQRFGLAEHQLRFFCQGQLPAVDATTRQFLLSSPDQLALSPDGHGGLLRALLHSGLVADLEAQGIDLIYYHQVDNPTVKLCDPEFIGWHLLERAEVSTKVVAKRSAEERMGVAVNLAGRCQIIEYSDLPADVARQTNPDGSLKIWAGSTAMHVFSLPFLKSMAATGVNLPFHIASKAVPYLDPTTGVLVQPAAPNALKFERFIFDVLPLAERSLIVETDRPIEFNPIKNKAGEDSPQTATAALEQLHRGWLRQHGVTIADQVPVEISPLRALEPEDAGGLVPPGTVVESALLIA